MIVGMSFDVIVTCTDPDVNVDEDVRHAKCLSGVLPPLDDLGAVGPIVRRCWDEQYACAADVVADLQAVVDGEDGAVSARLEEAKAAPQKAPPEEI
ncbi:hypothetical protein SCUCBS95973_007483 [Sporothrix curviconia]|uniref:Uncharacterized protein n=1 Tax=Sporothrix curviconia TaxID=1260050 RepID=A0ABP0CG41_9PEZI